MEEFTAEMQINGYEKVSPRGSIGSWKRMKVLILNYYAIFLRRTPRNDDLSIVCIDKN